MTTREGDDSDRLLDSIRDASQRGGRISLLGSGSKSRRFPQLHAAGGAALSTLEHAGILYYAPDELVLEARSGTRLSDVVALLAEHRQQLAFEPPQFRRAGTLGGAVASGLAGPARPWGGAPRDAVLGVEMINGRAERLRFGGRVVKNVAGYDLARLQAGAFGTFGCLLSVAVRVMPEPARRVTLAAQLNEGDALECLRAWHLADLPLTASCWLNGELCVRLAGAGPAVEQAEQRLQSEVGARLRQVTGFWTSLRDQVHPFFDEPPPDGSLYRCSLPVSAGPLGVSAPMLAEWRGAQRWYWLDETQLPALADACRAAGGWLARAEDPSLGTSDDPVVSGLSSRLRQAFDPNGCFNAQLVAHAH